MSEDEHGPQDATPDGSANDKAREARQGLRDSVVGKAKELAGAVSGHDDLVEEGQLQQAGASNRRAALAEEAVADARSAEVVQELHETDRDAAQRQEAARAATARETAEIDRERAADHDAVERAADTQATQDRAAAEKQADELAESRLQDAEAMEADASATEREAATERARLEQQATDADHEAAQLRDRIEDRG